MPSNQHAIRVGANVRAEMARRGISQKALAKTLDTTQQKLSRRISGQTAFKVDELHQVATALGVSTADLMADDTVRASA